MSNIARSVKLKSLENPKYYILQPCACWTAKADEFLILKGEAYGLRKVVEKEDIPISVKTN